MIGPDQDLSQFPPWILPYICVAELARSREFAAREQSVADAHDRDELDVLEANAAFYRAFAGPAS